MAYFEVGNTLFRGTLAGAYGSFDLDVAADTADVIDTLNIQHGAVTSQVMATINNRWISSGGWAISAALNVVDSVAAVEVIAYCNRGAETYFGNYRLVPRSGYAVNKMLLPLRQLFVVNRGVYTAKIIAGSTGAASGYLLCRYIRETGSNNA